MEEEVYFVELYKARKMYSIIRSSMEMLDKAVPNSIIKNNLKMELNKILQYLKLKQLRVFTSDGEDISEKRGAEINQIGAKPVTESGTKVVNG